MTQVQPDYFARFANQYVPAMAYSAAVNLSGPLQVDFGTPTVGNGDGILDGVAADNSGPYTYTTADFIKTNAGFDGSTGEFTDARYGRAISAVGSAAGVTQDITVKGRDYLGQPISKTVAMTGTTPVVIATCFKYVDSVTIAVGAASETIDVGWTDNLGLPYKCVRVLSEEANNAPVATLGTLAAPVLTDPATAATGDPRGHYDPQTTLNGSTLITGTFIADDSVNAAGNGGLHGIRHFFA